MASVLKAITTLVRSLKKAPPGNGKISTVMLDIFWVDLFLQIGLQRQ